MTEQPAGTVLDALGVTLDIEDEDQITEVVVLAKVSNFGTGETGLIIGRSEGLDWIAQRGLLSAAQLVCDRGDIDE